MTKRNWFVVVAAVAIIGGLIAVYGVMGEAEAHDKHDVGPSKYGTDAARTCWHGWRSNYRVAYPTIENGKVKDAFGFAIHGLWVSRDGRTNWAWKSASATIEIGEFVKACLKQPRGYGVEPPGGDGYWYFLSPAARRGN